MASFDLFPPAEAQIGLAWGNTKTPVFSTLVNESVSGLESRIGLQTYPRWRFDLEYKKLEATGDPEDQLRALLGFFLARRARQESFLYRDTEDNHLDQQLLGIGNGVQYQYQIVRTYGGQFVEPVAVIGHSVDIPGLPSSLHTYVDGVEGNWHYNGAGSVNIVDSFGAPLPPPVGSTVAVTCDMYYRVRFVQDEQEVEQLVHNFWTAQQVQLISVKNPVGLE